MKIALAGRSGCRTRLLAACAAAALPAVALAHVDRHAGVVPATGWTITPDILIGLLLAAALYAAGLRHQRGKDGPALRWKHASFFSGLAALFIALQSPLDALAEHLFFVHQVQHLLLQTVAPMLLMLATPQRLLVAGMPPLLRRRVLAPLMSSRAVRGLFRCLAQPWIAALLLVASLYVWHWPPLHDTAVLREGVHYLMHVTMLAAGLIFFWCVFDPRPPPLGAAYGTRVNVLWFAMSANMLLGAALALKETVLYTAYEQAGRLWGFGALEDEQLGGLIMWIPGSIVCLPAFIIILRIWNSQDERIFERRRRGIAPAAPDGRSSGLRVALWLAAMAFAVFAGTIGMGMIATGQHF